MPKPSKIVRGLRVTDQEAEILRIPKLSLPEYGYLMDIGSQGVVKFSPDMLTYKLQQTILSYFSDDVFMPESEYTYWLTVLKGRQTGSSNTCALCQFPLVAYTPGFTSAIIADNKKRADEVFSRLDLAYNRWPEKIRTDKASANESRSYTTNINSKVVVYSAESPDVGVGLSVDSLVASEIPLWADAGRQLSAIIPAMFNRKTSRMVLESTSQPLDAPSGQWWYDHWRDSVRGKGRFVGAFFPFWDSKANVRPWPKNSKMTPEEIRLLERYGGVDRFGHPGLTKENLAFRRDYMETDVDVKRNPEMFPVWFPFDDLSCWVSQGKGIIPRGAIEKFLTRDLYEETEDYNEFPDTKPTDGSEPRYKVNPDAVYIMGVDPAGYGRDHQSFQVLEVWDEEWVQVASFGANMDPNDFISFALEVATHFNTAKVVIERPGVGAGHAMLARHLKYPNLHYDERGKPGLHKVNDEEWLSKMVDALLDNRLILRGKDTVSQVQGYRHDRKTARTQTAELLGYKSDGRRRARHHWDKVSALMVACVVAPRLPRRYRRVDAEPEAIKSWSEMTFSEQEAFRERYLQLGQKEERRFYYRRG